MYLLSHITIYLNRCKQGILKYTSNYIIAIWKKEWLRSEILQECSVFNFVRVISLLLERILSKKEGNFDLQNSAKRKAEANNWLMGTVVTRKRPVNAVI